MIDLLEVRFNDHRKYFEDLVIHQDGITYFVKADKNGNWSITQEFKDTYSGAHPYGIYNDSAYELYPIDYTKSEPKPVEADYDYNEEDALEDLESALNRRNRSKRR